MNKPELIEAIVNKNEIFTKKEVGDFIDIFEEVVSDTVASGNDINLSGFMKIYSVDVPAKEGNCAGKAYSSPAHKTVRVKVGKTLKDSVK